jgi:hypothetical protein
VSGRESPSLLVGGLGDRTGVLASERERLLDEEVDTGRQASRTDRPVGRQRAITAASTRPFRSA